MDASDPGGSGGDRVVGRPTKYKADYARQAKKLCQLGAIDIDLAEFFEVSLPTIYEWRARYRGFSESLKVGKDGPDDRVERSLYQRAVGYSAPEDKVFVHEGVPVIVPTIKYYPPDPTSCIFWLKNRRRDLWREKPDDQTPPHQPVTIQFIRAGDNDGDPPESDDSAV